MPEKFKASIKVMRSYDYCHFEAVLGSDELLSLDEIDDMRKHAAILVDEAIRQYKEAKSKESDRSRKDYDREFAARRIENIKAKPGSEWNPEEAAIMRSVEDGSFWKSFDEDDYWYQDPDRDYHFSMLRKFKDHYKARVKAG